MASRRTTCSSSNRCWWRANWPMNPQQFRRARDLETVFALQRRFPTRLEILSRTGNPARQLELAFRIPTAADCGFPRRRRNGCRGLLDIPNAYPFEPARVTLLDSVFNPNVFPSGLVCAGQEQGTNWTLGDLIWRVMRIIALDPEIINCERPADGDAAEWYLAAKAKGIFPSLALGAEQIPDGSGIAFRDLRPEATR